MKCINSNYVHKYLAKHGYEREFTPQLCSILENMSIQAIATYIDKYLGKAHLVVKNK